MVLVFKSMRLENSVTNVNDLSMRLENTKSKLVSLTWVPQEEGIFVHK